MQVPTRRIHPVGSPLGEPQVLPDRRDDLPLGLGADLPHRVDIVDRRWIDLQYFTVEPAGNNSACCIA
jgi:hypothetical protein